MGAEAFKLRRVLIAIVLGLVVVVLGFYGWIQYRQSQYSAREQTVLTRYHDSYTLCRKLGNYGCDQHVLAACVRDPFWLTDKPFAAAGTAPPDPIAPCAKVAVAG